MGEIVNLRMARKAKARAEATRVAAANRVRHGRTKAERAAEAQASARAAALHAGHALTGATEDDA